MEFYQKRGGDLVQLVAPGIGADVPLSDAVDSDSSVTAASSRAVKAAWNKAVEAMESGAAAGRRHAQKRRHGVCRRVWQMGP